MHAQAKAQPYFVPSLGVVTLTHTLTHAQAKAQPYFVPSGSLGFSVMIFTILAFAAIALLVGRRKYGGELGGATRETQV